MPRIIDGVPERPRGADRRRLARRGRGIQTGSLAVYAFVMLIGLVAAGQPLPACSVSAMNAAGFPILSLITFLPLVGASASCRVRGDEATVAANATLDRAVDQPDRLRALPRALVPASTRAIRASSSSRT